MYRTLDIRYSDFLKNYSILLRLRGYISSYMHLTTLYDVIKIVIRVYLYTMTNRLPITPRRAYALDTIQDVQ